MESQNVGPISQPAAAFRLDVCGKNGVTLAATIREVEISSDHASCIVEWLGVDFEPNLINLVSQETVWGQCLNLVFSAAAPQSIPPVPIFGANEWSSVVLTLPDLLGEEGDIVCVEVTSADWQATLFVTCQPELSLERWVPMELRFLDAATTVVEMTARIFLGRSWLTLELTPQ